MRAHHRRMLDRLPAWVTVPEDAFAKVPKRVRSADMRDATGAAFSFGRMLPLSDRIRKPVGIRRQRAAA